MPGLQLLGPLFSIEDPAAVQYSFWPPRSFRQARSCSKLLSRRSTITPSAQQPQHPSFTRNPGLQATRRGLPAHSRDGPTADTALFGEVARRAAAQCSPPRRLAFAYRETGYLYSMPALLRFSPIPRAASTLPETSRSTIQKIMLPPSPVRGEPAPGKTVVCFFVKPLMASSIAEA